MAELIGRYWCTASNCLNQTAIHPFHWDIKNVLAGSYMGHIMYRSHWSLSIVICGPIGRARKWHHDFMALGGKFPKQSVILYTYCQFYSPNGLSQRKIRTNASWRMFCWETPLVVAGYRPPWVPQANGSSLLNPGRDFPEAVDRIYQDDKRRLWVSTKR